ncbi:hypothetical protein AX16_004393 [Volvariella volvacea WC 439]|nr:hypothetical protein AX16_004393 [Volvariella volvacea WC 439]
MCLLPSETAHEQQHESYHTKDSRRRSVPVVLYGASQDDSSEDFQGDLGMRFAELLGDMYQETLNEVNRHSADFVTTDLPAETRSRLVAALDTWQFEPYNLDDNDVVACTLLLFEALYRVEGMEEAVGISLDQLSPFIQHLRQIYRWKNSYHNYEHALDVLQATQSYLQSEEMVPPLSILLEPNQKWKRKRAFDSGPLITCLGLREVFVLYVAAIGHDVGHPGFTNLFMNNARTPLSIVYDGKSALEHMHGHLLLRVMRHHGLGGLVDSGVEGVNARKLLWQSVLATDMSVHGTFMNNFQKLVDNPRQGTLCDRQVLVCQALLKCADISNPSRPYCVSQHWASALIEEWFLQAMFEQQLALPQSVQSSKAPLKEAESQVFFITAFAKPLLDLVSSLRAIPGMREYAQQCTSNLEQWRERCMKLARQTEQNEELPPPPVSPDAHFQGAFPPTLPFALRPTGSGSSSSSEVNFAPPPPSSTSTLAPPSSAASGSTIVSSGNNGIPTPPQSATAKKVTKQSLHSNRNSWSPLPSRSPASHQPLHVARNTSSPLASATPPSSATPSISPTAHAATTNNQ